MTGRKRTDRERELQEAADRLAMMAGNAPVPQPVKPQPTTAPAVAPKPPLQVKMQQWEVRGAFRESGKEAALIIEAQTQAAAEYEAVKNGLLVESCWPVRQQVAPPMMPPPPMMQGPHPLPYGQPIPHAVPIAPPVSHIVTERTAKRFKWQLLAAFGLCLFGMFSSCILTSIAASVSPKLGAPFLIFGVTCFVGGLVWGSVVKWMAWWHHG